jgi:hypothetical protein
MDVSKAKNVVIILLLAFNIFLLVNTFIVRGSQGVSRETLENTKIILAKRGVSLECEIPSKPVGSSRLVYIKSELNREEIAGKLLGNDYDVSGDGSQFYNDGGKLEFFGPDRFTYTAGTADMTTEPISMMDADEAAMKFMKGKGLLDGKYEQDQAAQNGDGSWTIDYIEVFGGSLLYDNYFSVTVTGGVVSRLEFRKHRFEGFSSESIEQFAAYQALLSYFKEENDIVITSIDSGYKLEESAMEDVESIELLPVWRVKIKSMSEPVYIRPHDA